jgi:hypothetical protein
VHFTGCGIAVSAALFVYLSSLIFKEPPKMVCGGLWVRLWRRGTVFDAVLSVNYCAIAIAVSVIAIQEKCDEKGLEGLIRGTAVLGVCGWAGPPSAIPLDFARGFGKTGQALSKSARRGAPPDCFRSLLKTNPRYRAPLKWPTRRKSKGFNLNQNLWGWVVD